ncbi:metallophosphoesterase [Solimicrobium silvestre]|uniref:Calcineurin-like phosphoesterase n=1 Tax=Solimicrobium silvestre TaxID=2099400 RepID=A0A2S9H434_9BURK|nr:metallophosphoesterase [Solimicrobium silvestre]PRC94745.1 Calcineurin-like phosphoesterase [Solimicrobium silvestre]
MNYDIIGDIHGHSDKLTTLLAKLGYREQAGAWRHSEKTAIFVGDFVDRGPGQLATIDIVRRMVDCGSAQAVLGNHEFNAIAWHTPDPAHDGEYLRVHRPKNRHQHAAFLAEVEHDKARHKEVIDWFMTLPLWLELDELRVIHACWHPAYMNELEPYLDKENRLTQVVVEAANNPESVLFQSVEALIKGLQIKLPDGVFYFDEDGHKRNKVRTCWWDADATTYRRAALLARAERERLPTDQIPASARILYANDKPLFIGHYWNRGALAPLTPHIACVDYSVGKGGALVAYRWEGESELKARQFVAV